MKPYYSHGGIQIYCGDCREILPTLEARSIDTVITDPPYGIVNDFGIAIKQDGIRKLSFDWDKPEGVAEGVAEGVRLCKSSASCFVFSSIDIVGLLLEKVREQGFICKPAAWVKECPPPAGFGNWWPSGFELAFYGYRNSPYFGDVDRKRSNVFVADSLRYGQPGKNGHPTQKPLVLMAKLVKALCRQDGMVLDPFMGSGTTLRAAKDAGCRAIGIEIEEKYCETAARRMEQEVFNFQEA